MFSRLLYVVKDMVIARHTGIIGLTTSQKAMVG